MEKFDVEYAKTWEGRNPEDYVGCYSGVRSKDAYGLEPKNVFKLIKKEIMAEINTGTLPKLNSPLSVRKYNYDTDVLISYEANCDFDLEDVVRDRLEGIVASYGFNHSPKAKPYSDERRFYPNIYLYCREEESKLVNSAEAWYNGIMKRELYEKERSREEVLKEYVGASSGINYDKVFLMDSSEEVREIKKALNSAIKSGEVLGKRALGRVGDFCAPGVLRYDFTIKGVSSDISDEENLKIREDAKEIIDSFNYNWNSRYLQNTGSHFSFFSSLELLDDDGKSISDPRCNWSLRRSNIEERNRNIRFI
jgi:hypothetical protein